MEDKLLIFKQLAQIYKDNGFDLYLVGGSVRDYLLGIPLTDMDVVTTATPDESIKFLDNPETAFAKYGSLKCKFQNVSFDITTLRKEQGYIDFRHPGKIEFVKNLEEDVVRRDFTCNSLYMDANLKIYDFANGQKDLENHTLKAIGVADKRIKEDPLRILRALRFSLTFKLTIDEELSKAIKDNIDLLKCLNPEKIKQEIKKIRLCNKEEIESLFNLFSIQYLLKVID